MTELAVVRDYAELVAALKARMHELGVTMETLDDIAGLPVRYVSKIFAPRPIKALGRISLGPLIGALGLKLIVAADPEQLARVQSRLVPRKGARACSSKHVVLTPAFYRKISAMGGLARSAKLTPHRRVAIARKAARARWQRDRLRSSGIAAPAAGAWPVAPEPLIRRARSAGSAAPKARLLPR